MIKLFVSNDCGCNYRLESEVENIGDIQNRIDELDFILERWYIEDESGENIKSCKIHNAIERSLRVLEYGL